MQAATAGKERIEVDVIIPVHNAAATIQEAVESALHQTWPADDDDIDDAFSETYSISLITVCCYDDGSTDNSLEILQRLQKDHAENKLLFQQPTEGSDRCIPSRLLVSSSANGSARGAGYARNRAIEMNNPPLQQSRVKKAVSASSTDHPLHKFLCLLDSDDIMHPHRVALQTHYMMTQISDPKTRRHTLLGCTFDRDPSDSTWHYSRWANALTDERLLLEQFREITVLQPTWFLSYDAWVRVGGYVEAPPADSGAADSMEDVIHQRQNDVAADALDNSNNNNNHSKCLIHPRFDTPSTLRLAEDLRFFHAHLQRQGTIRTLRHQIPLVTYRYFGDSTSQSFRTSRKLLLQLRVLALEQRVLSAQWKDEPFIIWGAGRDGKDVYKALDPKHQANVYCFVDVDAKKLNAGFYVAGRGDDNINGKNHASRKIPIVHFSFLIPDEATRIAVQTAWLEDKGAKDSQNGSIDKSQQGKDSPSISTGRSKKKRQKLDPSAQGCQLRDRGLDQHLLQKVSVVVCVAMYRTNGVLEKNVASIARKEGESLWHFS